MRAAWLVLFTLLPVANAQGDLDIAVTVDPAPGLAAPLEGTVTMSGAVDVPCALAAGDPRGVSVSVWIDSAPAWASAVATPASFGVDVASCGSAMRHVEPVTIVVRANDRAPAFAPEPLLLAAAVVDASGANHTGRGSAEVEADYFAILDVQLAEAIQVASPGDIATFEITVTNRGNDRSIVTLAPLDVSDGYAVETPAPVVLASPLGGGEGASAVARVDVRAPEGTGYVNEVGTATLRVTIAHAEGTGLDMDEATVSLLLTAKGVGTPALGLAPTVCVLVVAARLARRE